MLPPAFLLAVLTQHPAVQADLLVSRLGAPSYAAREHASRQLMGFGRPGIWAARRGLSSPDAEIAERCRRLLPIIEEETAKRRLDRLRTLLIEDPNRRVPDDEPLLSQFLKITGDTRADRALYFEMFQKHGKLLDCVELSDGVAGGVAFWEYVDRVLMYPDGRTVVNLLTQSSPRGEVAILWFLSAYSPLRPIPIKGSNRSDFPFFGTTYAKTHLIHKDSASLKKLLARWLEGPRNIADAEVDAKMVHAGFRLAATAMMKEVRSIALKAALDRKRDVRVRSGALAALMVIGHRADVNALTPLIAESTRVDLRSGVKVTIGDLALSACARLTNYRIDGLDKASPSDDSLIHFGFVTDAHRDAALIKWSAWANANLAGGGKR